MDKIEVGAKIRKLREERKMTQYSLALNAGVSHTYIAQLERGEKSPTIEYLDHICWGLGISLENFFSDKEKKTGDRIDSLTDRQKKLLNDFLDSLN